MHLLTASEAKKADEIAMSEEGLSSSVLMKNAAAGALAVLQRYHNLKGKRVLIFAGPGHNGGDGRVMGRLMTPLAKKVRMFSVPTRPHDTIPSIHLKKIISDSDLIVDAIFGTGLSRNIFGFAKDVIQSINESRKWILSLDLPSGLSADTGQPLGVSVKAHVTVTFGLPKIGLVLPHASEWVGRMEVVDIGIPSPVYDKVLPSKNRIFWMTQEEVRLPLRQENSHKGTHGHVLLLGGSQNKPGSILLSGQAALRTGAGLVTVALPDKAFQKLRPGFLELMYEPLPSQASGTISWKAKAKKLFSEISKNKSVLAVGPGLGVTLETRSMMKSLFETTSPLAPGLPLLLDADALNSLSRPEILHRRFPVVLTPHPGEMARLIGTTTTFVQKNRIEIAREFATTHNVWLVLKGFRTLTACPQGDVWINSTGNPGMATAGMGDVLTGVLSSLIAQCSEGTHRVQGTNLDEAIRTGVFLHGLAGDHIAKRIGTRGLIASDVIDEMPRMMKFCFRP